MQHVADSDIGAAINFPARTSHNAYAPIGGEVIGTQMTLGGNWKRRQSIRCDSSFSCVDNQKTVSHRIILLVACLLVADALTVPSLPGTPLPVLSYSTKVLVATVDLARLQTHTNVVAGTVYCLQSRVDPLTRRRYDHS